MIKFFLVPVLVVLEYFVHRFFGGWLLFDPLLALVLVYAFFHYLETRPVVLFALWCGFWQDMTSLGPFSIFMISYVVSALAVAYLTRLVNRHNRLLIFPVVFSGQILNNHAVFFLNFVLSGGLTYSFLFFGRTFLEAAGTTLLAYPAFLLFRRIENIVMEDEEAAEIA